MKHYDPKPEKENFEKMFTVMEVAELLNYHPQTILRKLESGEIKGVKQGTIRNSRWRITAAEIKRLQGLNGQ